jgi:hypothetical protein
MLADSVNLLMASQLGAAMMELEKLIASSKAKIQMRTVYYAMWEQAGS